MELFFVSEASFNLVPFTLPLDNISDYYKDEVPAVARKRMSADITKTLSKLGREIPIPESLVLELSDEELDEFLINLETNLEKVAAYVFATVPPEQKMCYKKLSSHEYYNSIGINGTAVVMLRDSKDDTSSVIGATDNELQTFFSLVDIRPSEKRS